MADARSASDSALLPRGRGGGLLVAGFLLLVAAYVVQAWLPLVAGVLLLIGFWHINRDIWPEVLREASVKPVCFARRAKVPPPPPSPERPAPAPVLAPQPSGQRARP